MPTMQHTCNACYKKLPKTAFSNNQWTKQARRCVACVTGNASTTAFGNLSEAKRLGFGVPHGQPSASPAVANAKDRTRLIALYSVVDPSKVAKVDQILQRRPSQSDRDRMWRLLKQRFPNQIPISTGQAPFAATNAATNVFGQTLQQPNPFGATPTPMPVPQTNVFGTAPTPGFGQQKNPVNLFGTPTPATVGFGQHPNPFVPVPAPQTNVFATPTPAPVQSTNMFATPTPAQPFNLFATPTPAPVQQHNLFAAPTPAPTPAQPFNMFAIPTPAPALAQSFNMFTPPTPAPVQQNNLFATPAAAQLTNLFATPTPAQPINMFTTPTPAQAPAQPTNLFATPAPAPVQQNSLVAAQPTSCVAVSTAPKFPLMRVADVVSPNASQQNCRRQVFRPMSRSTVKIQPRNWRRPEQCAAAAQSTVVRSSIQPPSRR